MDRMFDTVVDLCKITRLYGEKERPCERCGWFYEKSRLYQCSYIDKFEEMLDLLGIVDCQYPPAVSRKREGEQRKSY